MRTNPTVDIPGSDSEPQSASSSRATSPAPQLMSFLGAPMQKFDAKVDASLDSDSSVDLQNPQNTDPSSAAGSSLKETVPALRREDTTPPPAPVLAGVSVINRDTSLDHSFNSGGFAPELDRKINLVATHSVRFFEIWDTKKPATKREMTHCVREFLDEFNA